MLKTVTNHFILQETEYHEQQGAEQTTEKSDPLLDYAFQVLYEITYSPGHFTHLCDQLISNLNSWPALDESMLQILVDEIVALVIYFFFFFFFLILFYTFFFFFFFVILRAQFLF